MNFLQTIMAILFFIVPVIMIAGLMKRFGQKLDFYENIMTSTFSVLISAILYLLLYRWVSGRSAFDVLWDGIRSLFVNDAVNTDRILSVYHQWGFFENFTTAEQLADFMISQLKQTVPAVIILWSLIYGIVLFLIIRFVMKKLGLAVPVVRPFEYWALPKGMALGLLVLLLVSFFGAGLGIKNFEIVQITITALISFLFTIVGLSVIWYFLKAGNIPAVLRWIIIILIYLFFGFVVPILGLLDQLFHMRMNYRNKFLFKNGSNRS
ncbi:MAG: DUF2232 domain-containing protein [Caldicoprobacterales bacterium]|jgi:hypothetical protein|nr:DUF2232 domain-containing protein [Clostridiales bacterium]